MRGSHLRILTLIGVLVAGIWLEAVLGHPVPWTSVRWPADETLAKIGDWSLTSAAGVQQTSAFPYTTRSYRSSNGMLATLVVTASTDPKLYRAGADVPFLGSGYVVEPVPPSLHVSVPGGNALVLQRQTTQWLVLYSYGERRGLLGNGRLGWSMAFADGILGQPNDYYKLYLVSRVDEIDGQAAAQTVSLANELFPRIAAAYAGS